MKAEGGRMKAPLFSIGLFLVSILFILHPSAFILKFFVRAPQFDFVFEFDAVLASEALAYLLCERERVRGARALAFGDDEVRVDGRDLCAAAPLALHAHLVNHLPRALARPRRVLEEATGTARAVRLRREAPLLRLLHPRPYLFGVVRLQTQRAAKKQLALFERRVTIVPLHLAARHDDDLTAARHANRLDHLAYLVTVRARVHPKRAADRARNAAEALNARKPRARRLDAQTRQRKSCAHRNALAVELRAALDLSHRDDDVAVLSVVGEHVASSAEHAPRQPRVFERAHNARGLLFRFRHEQPVNRPAHAQRSKLREAPTALCAHAATARNLFDPRVALSRVGRVRLFTHHF